LKKDLPRFPPAAWTDSSLRAPSLILTGCGLNIAGALLYQQSFPPPPGSPKKNWLTPSANSPAPASNPPQQPQQPPRPKPEAPTQQKK